MKTAQSNCTQRTGLRVFAVGIGVISSAGVGARAFIAALNSGKSFLAPLTLFDVPESIRYPIGGVLGFNPPIGVPRTHALALTASREAMAGSSNPPSAIVVGVTTGGMPESEIHLKNGRRSPALFRLHGAESVGTFLASELGCLGPVFIVSTACSSGATALAIATKLIKSGEISSALAVGTDALCMMTYHGFRCLHLIDSEGSRPLSSIRNGISLGEGAGAILLEGAFSPPHGTLAEITGIGLSCDAYHMATPHPDGAGAQSCMEAALTDAGLNASEIEFVNLHGTGTIENDKVEALAVNRVFGGSRPLVSSLKGCFGHTLGAAGIIESIAVILGISEGLLPGTVGCQDPDASLNLNVLRLPCRRKISAAMLNSLGFGGNNTSIVISDPSLKSSGGAPTGSKRLAIISAECLTGVGSTASSFSAFLAGDRIKGLVPDSDIATPPQNSKLRRLKRISRISLCLADRVCRSSGLSCPPEDVCFATAWGSQTDTHDFLMKLFSSEDLLSSPIDFINSVYNAPASQSAIALGIRGTNLTMVGISAFEQALFAMSSIGRDDSSILLVGADEWNPELSPLINPCSTEEPGDGGGAFLLSTAKSAKGPVIEPLFYGRAHGGVINKLMDRLGGGATVRECFKLVMVGWPAEEADQARLQLVEFMGRTRYKGPVIEYNRQLGHSSCAPAIAAVMSVKLIEHGSLPAAYCSGKAAAVTEARILLLTLGGYLSAVSAGP